MLAIRGTEFFVRTGPMTTPLKGDDVDRFIANNFTVAS
jgi:hypothetical protein